MHPCEKGIPSESASCHLHQVSQMTNSSEFHFLAGSDGKSICLQCRRLGFDPWVGKIPWRRKWQPTPVFLPGKFHGRRSLIGYSPGNCKESDTTKRFHFFTPSEYQWSALPRKQIKYRHKIPEHVMTIQVSIPLSVLKNNTAIKKTKHCSKECFHLPHCLFLATPHSMWDLSSPPRDGTHTA